MVSCGDCCALVFLDAEVGVAGGGGEYEVLAGFGWSNGVALSFLDKYGWQG